MPSRVRVYIASSLDGFIAGPNDDLSWLMGPEAANPGGESDPDALTYEAFIADVGALLMGRGTFDVVQRAEWWGYGDRPVLVATHRDLGDGVRDTVRAVSGSIEEMVTQAKEAASGKDVYIDGGNLIRQAAEAGLIDDLTITLAPIALGEGHPLFAGLSRPYPLKIVNHHTYAGGMVQIQARPK
ncbi:MAG: dihydrofolate reductase family protein [Gemmatimonadota bacterium]